MLRDNLRLSLVMCGTVLIGVAPAAAESPKPLLEEPFSAARLDGWDKAIGPESKLEVKDGWATFEGPLSSRAHIQRSAPQDDIMVSATVARWAAVYVVWDAENWCGVGKVSPTPFGRFYNVEVVDGKPTEVDHRGVDFNAPHRVRIQLGKDYVRFQYADGPQYVDLRTIERPASWAGTPKLIVTGKSYGAENTPFAEKEAARKLSEGKVSGAVRELRVRATPGSDLKLSAAELQAVRHPRPEPVGALLSQSEDDPTYEQVARYYPPFRSPREVMGVPAHPLDIGVDRLGRLDVSPWGLPLAWFEVGDPPKPFGQEGIDNGAYFTWNQSAAALVAAGKANTIKRRLLNGYLPILTLGTRVEGNDCELTVFGWSEGFSPEKDLYAYVRVTARSAGGGKLPAQMSLVWGSGDKRRTWKSAVQGDRADCCLRFKYPQPETATEIAAAEFEAKSKETAAFWSKALEPATRFEVPDPRVMEAYRAWIVYSMLNSDLVKGYVEPHDGAGFYEEMFGNSVSLHSMAMDMYGLHDWVAKVLDTQMHYQQPDGLYTQACGLVDPGGFLAGLARHYQMTRDQTWLKRVSPSMIKQCDWLIKQRAAAPKEGMLKGLIKFRPYNDYVEPVYNYLGNVWCAQGMRFAAEAFKEIGAPEAEKYAREAADYRRDILESMATAAIQRDGQTLLPMEPDTQRLLKLSKYRGGDYYGLVASPLLGTGFLAPDDKRTTWIVDALEKRGGPIAGVCEFECGIDHAYTYGYLMNALQRGEVRKTLLGFWSFFAFGMTRDTYSPVEVTMIGTGENHYTLPHLYSCTEQLRLLRGLLVREEGDVLWLGQGIPRAWLEPGKHVAVRSAPTEFGEVSYRLEAHQDGSMQVHIDPPLRSAPSEIRIRLRHPASRSIAAVTISPEGPCGHSQDTIVLRGLRAPADVQVRFDSK